MTARWHGSPSSKINRSGCATNRAKIQRTDLLPSCRGAVGCRVCSEMEHEMNVIICLLLYRKFYCMISALLGYVVGKSQME